MDMFRGLGGLERGLEASWMRNSTILNNVANVDTPDFKASHVEFEDLYKAAIEEAGSEDADKAAEGVRAVVVQDDDTTYRIDGGNVDIDKQMTDLAKNVIYYNTLTTKASGQINQLRMAIKEG